MSLTDYVSTLQGTASDREWSVGLTLPLVGVPRGLTYFTPQTSDTAFVFDLRKNKLSGFRATHCPSAWMGDFGHFDLLPFTHDVAPQPHVRASAYRKEAQHAKPHLYRTRLLRYGIDCEMTATRACGVFRFTYPADAGDRAGLVVQTGRSDVSSKGEARIERTDAGVRIYGVSAAHKGGAEEGFACYYVADVHGVVPHELGALDAETLMPGTTSLACDRAGVYARFRVTGAHVIVRVATSFVSHEQALLNLSREVGDRDFDDVADATRRQWEKWLSRVRPRAGTERDLRVLYSCLYRVGTFPTPLHEFDAAGRPHHRSPYDGKVRPGVLYTNQGLWDAYRTVYPLLAVIDRTGLGEIVQGFLEAYRQSGWFPRWPSPGLRQCMIGSHGDSMVADAVLSGVTGFDHAEAYEAIRKDAYVHSDDPRLGRAALSDYLRLGYVPSDVTSDSVCWTLDNAHCDWCVAQVATKLGRHDDAAELMRRSRNYRNVWHPGSRLMRPRRADGSWHEPFREFEWGGPYVEGSAWQHSLHAPHDPHGLADLHGGVDALLDRVDELFRLPPRYERGPYWEEVHEMTALALAADDEGKSFGQYAHSNQPVHQYLFLSAALGHPDRSAGHITRVMKHLYTPDTFPGDEDNGEMSAWYLLCAAGRVPQCPGSGKLLEMPIDLYGRAELIDVGP